MAQTIRLKRSAVAGRIPTINDLELGEVAINTVDGKMYIKKSVGGVESIVEVGSGGGYAASAMTQYTYIATSGQTTVTGADYYSQVLDVADELINIYLNGVLLDPDTDYTVESGGLTITFTNALAADDLVQVNSFDQAVFNGTMSVDTLVLNGGTGDQGTLSWNADESTVDLIVGEATLQIGQEQYFRGKATEAIANGDVVMFAGAQGSHLLIAKADMSSVGFRPEYVIGIATQSLAIGEFGFVTTFGKVRNLNTSSIAEGTILYVDPNTAGGLTATRPSAPDHVIQMCAVVYSHALQGTYLVRPTHFPDTDEVEEGTTNLYWTTARGDANFATNLAASDTDDLSEGSTNLYWTTARGDANFATNLAASDTDDLSEGTTNLYYTSARANADFDTRLATKSTTDLSEGTNLYYTDARVGTYLTTNTYATQNYVDTAVSNLVDAAPATLDTLNELAAALGDDPNFATTVSTAIGTKWTQDNTKISNWDTAYTYSQVGHLPLAGGSLTGKLTTAISVNDYISVFQNSSANPAKIRVYNSQGTNSSNRAGIEFIASKSGSAHGQHAWIYAEGNGTDAYDTDLKIKVRADANYDLTGSYEAADHTVFRHNGDVDLKRGGLQINGTTVIDSSSNFINATSIGVGTSSPVSPLHISAAPSDTNGVLTVENTYTSGGTYFPTARFVNKESNHSYGTVAEFRTEITNSAAGTDRPTILFSTEHSSHTWQVGMSTSPYTDDFMLGYRGTSNDPNTFSTWYTQYFTVKTDGKVGIGVTNPQDKFHVSGGKIKITGSGNVASYGYIKGVENTFNTHKLVLGSTYGYSTDVDAISIFNTNVDILTGSLQMGGTTVIDSSRNLTNVGTINGSTISNWDTAYGWGDHSTAGYLTSVPNDTTEKKFGGIKISGVSSSENYIAFYGTTGDQNGNYNHSYIGERIYDGTEKSELVIAKYNDVEGASGSDRVRVIGNNFQVDTYIAATSAAANASLGTAVTTGTLYTRFKVRQNGDIEVGGSKFSDSNRNLTNIGTINGSTISNWDTAYGWGDHSGLYLPVGGGTVSGNITFANSGTAKRGVTGTMGDNDQWFVGGGATASNAGYLEISTGDDGQTAGSYENIYVRQYGAGTPFTGTLQRTLTLLDNNGNTSIPQTLTVNGALSVETSEIYDAADNMLAGLRHSGSDFPNGTLVKTNIPATATNGASFVLECTGKSYSTGVPPFNFMAQGYLYSDTIIATSGINNGDNRITYIKAMEYQGYLCFWWPRVSYWNSFEVRVRDAGGSPINRVTTIIDSVEPSVTKKVTINMIQSVQYDVWNGGTLNGGYLTLGQSGSTPSITMNYYNHPSGAVWDTRVHIGRSQDLPQGSSAPTYTASGCYGMHLQCNSDGVFYGMEEYTTGNYRPLINWGDDSGDSPFRIAFNNTTKFQMDYAGNFTASSNITAYSDIKLKDNIHTIEDALEKVLSLRGVTYTRKDQKDSEKIHMGVIAQEVETILPEVVHYNKEEDIKTVSYGNMVGVLIEAIKEQNSKIERLEALVQQLMETK